MIAIHPPSPKFTANRPWVSVIVPTFNRSHLIRETLESVRCQTYRPIEIVVIDDGSTDDTSTEISRWTDQFAEPGLLEVVFERQENQGPGAARNRGLRRSRGSLIQYLDSDDRLLPERFESLVPMFVQNPELDFIQTGFERFCSRCNSTLLQQFGNPGPEPLGLALRGRLWANTLRSMVRRSALEGIDWNVDMNCFEDYELVIRVLAKARHAICIRDISAQARRLGSQQLSQNQVSYEGRAQRIHCEEVLARSAATPTQAFSQINPDDLSQFRSRIYGLGLRCRSRGWEDHAARCRALADQVDAPLDSLGKRRRRVLLSGSWAARGYELLGNLKRGGNANSQERQHSCPQSMSGNQGA